MPCAAAGCRYPPSPRLKTNNWQTRIRGSGKNCRSNGGWGGRRSSRGMLERETQIQQYERDLMSPSGSNEAKPGKKAFFNLGNSRKRPLALVHPSGAPIKKLASKDAEATAKSHERTRIL